jgi:hypothetical protein
LNLFYADGRPAQDQLTLNAVPEPGTLSLLGVDMPPLGAPNAVLGAGNFGTITSAAIRA